MGHVRDIATYPVKEEPGVFHDSIEIEPEGPAGDRRKKRPVHLVGAEITPEHTRANIFLTLPEAELQAMIDARVLLGDAVLYICEIPKACPGVYAVVVQTGVVALDDDIRALQ